MNENEMYLSDGDIDSIWNVGFDDDADVVVPAEKERVVAEESFGDEDLFAFDENGDFIEDFDKITDEGEDDEDEGEPEKDEKFDFDEIDGEDDEGDEIYEDGSEEFDDIDLDDEVLVDLGDEFGNVKFGELRNNYRAQEVLKREFEQYQTEYVAFQEEKRQVSDLLNLARLEADLEIQEYNYENINWQRMSKERPDSYAEHRPYYEKLLAKKAKAQEALTNFHAHNAVSAQESIQAKAQEALITLRRDIPGFDANLANEILQHAVEHLGADPAQAKNETNPAVIKAYHESLLRKKGITELATKTKAKKVRRARPVVAKGATRSTGASDKNSKATRALANGDLSSSDLFNALID